MQWAQVSAAFLTKTCNQVNDSPFEQGRLNTGPNKVFVHLKHKQSNVKKNHNFPFCDIIFHTLFIVPPPPQ